jgi:phosphosulfolactate phosphohydrolase-like enzyme
LNIDALADLLRAHEPKKVLMVCAGTFETFALEDAYAAGALIETLQPATQTDAALTVRTMAAAYPAPLAALGAARNGQALAASGRTSDVEWCAQRSKYSVIGEMSASVIRALPA